MVSLKAGVKQERTGQTVAITTKSQWIVHLCNRLMSDIVVSSRRRYESLTYPTLGVKRLFGVSHAAWVDSVSC